MRTNVVCMQYMLATAVANAKVQAAQQHAAQQQAAQLVAGFLQQAAQQQAPQNLDLGQHWPNPLQAKPTGNAVGENLDAKLAHFKHEAEQKRLATEIARQAAEQHAAESEAAQA